MQTSSGRRSHKPSSCLFTFPQKYRNCGYYDKVCPTEVNYSNFILFITNTYKTIHLAALWPKWQSTQVCFFFKGFYSLESPLLLSVSFPPLQTWVLYFLSYNFWARSLPPTYKIKRKAHVCLLQRVHLLKLGGKTVTCTSHLLLPMAHILSRSYLKRRGKSKYITSQHTKILLTH